MPNDRDEALLRVLETRRADLTADERRRLARTWSLVALLGLVAGGLFVWLVLREPREVTGTVRCASGADVTGVWVKEAKGSGGFASLEPQSYVGRTVARYVYDVRGWSYGLNVGCGGSPQNWQVEVRSGYARGTSHDFVCHDTPTDPLFRRCLLTGG